MARVRLLIAGLVVAGTLTWTVIGASAGADQPKSSSSGPLAGVSVYFDDAVHLTSAQTLAKAAEVFTYVKSLGANAVSIDFPFYETGATKTSGAQGASSVQSGTGTPSPQVLETVIRMAESKGLTVQLRPLLSELGDDLNAGVFRGTIVPKNPAEWFQSYTNWLVPYLYVAQVTGVTSFSLGAELSSLVTGAPITIKAPGSVNTGIHDYLPYWEPLVQTARSIYTGTLLYSGSHMVLNFVPGIGFGFDAYSAVTISGAQPTSKTPTATVVNDFEPKILTNYKVQQDDPYNQEMIEELGISAEVGSWKTPWVFSYSKTTPIARWVQEDWITASCDAFNALNMQALYVWSIDLSTFSPTYNSDREHNPDAFQGTASEGAIRSCFASIERRG